MNLVLITLLIFALAISGSLVADGALENAGRIQVVDKGEVFAPGTLD